MSRRPRGGRALLAGLLALLVPGLFPSPATAATCTFNAGTRTIQLTHADDPAIEETLQLARTASGAIVFGVGTAAETPCGAATVTNTDRIFVTGSEGDERVNVSQAGGPFAPGATAESTGVSEIEISVDLGAGEDVLSIGTPAQNSIIVIGDGALNIAGLNQAAVTTDADADIDIFGAEDILGFGGAGRDQLSGQGGNGTGPAIPEGILLQGLGNNDTITGGLGNDSLAGLFGNDTLDGAAGDDDLNGTQGIDTMIGGPGNDVLRAVFGDDTHIPGPGDDTVFGTSAERDTVSYSGAAGPVEVRLAQFEATGEGTDELFNVDNVIGSGFGDEISGDNRRNFLNGRGGNDVLQGAQENDSLLPGPGTDDVRGGSEVDTVAYLDHTSGVDIDLGAGTATSAQGNDVIALNVENATGSPFGDEITGTDTRNVLSGFDGDDDLFGLAGDDVLDGGNGNDDLDGGPGNDLCGQAAGTGTLTSCETVGTFELKPRDARARVGQPIDYLVTWTHPRRWRRLDSVELRVREGQRVLAWVRWNQEGNTFQLFRPGAGRFGPAAPGGSSGTLSSPFAVLHLRGSDALAISPETIAVMMRLSFRRAAAGDHVVEVTAEDDRNNRDSWHPAGRLRVTGA